MFVFKYMDGDEELCEEDFIESEKVFGDPSEQKKFLMTTVQKLKQCSQKLTSKSCLL